MNLISHADLVSRGAKWLSYIHEVKQLGYRQSAMGLILTEYKCYASEIPDVIGFNSFQTVVIECKVSRFDFLHDFKKGHRHYQNQLGNYRYYLVTPNICNEKDVPEGWGLLYCQSNHIDIVVKAPRHDNEQTRIVEYSILYSLARRANIRGYIPSLLSELKSDCEYQKKGE